MAEELLSRKIARLQAAARNAAKERDAEGVEHLRRYVSDIIQRAAQVEVDIENAINEFADCAEIRECR